MREIATLPWPVAIDGYEAVELSLADYYNHPAYLDTHDTYMALRPVENHPRANIRTYDLFRDEPALFRTFADIPTTNASFVAFANKYGQLFARRRSFRDQQRDEEQPDYKYNEPYRSAFWDENLIDWGEAVHDMNSRLTGVGFHRSLDSYKSLMKSIRVNLTPRFPDFAGQSDRLVLGKSSQVPHFELELTPISLLEGMKLQFALHSTKPPGELRQCEQCGEWFYVGPGTGHRSNAKYCSQQCYGRAKHKRHKKRKADAQTTKGTRRKK